MRHNGTTITFMADQSIFTSIDYSYETLTQRFREMAYLTKGLSITLIDERPGPGDEREWTFYFEGGIVSFVRHLNLSREPAPPAPVLRGTSGARRRDRGGPAVQRQLRRERLHVR